MRLPSTWIGWLLVGFALTALGVACTPELTCEDVGCAFGLACNPESGDCVRPATDCRLEDSCSPDERCDEDGICRPKALQCTVENSCPRGQSCNTQSGFCEPAFRCTIDGCPDGEVCDANTESCEAQSCVSDDDCPPIGFTCGDDRRCAPGCRFPGGLCQEDTTCAPTGVCAPRCASDQGCAFGQFCDTSRSEPSCQDEGPCLEDLECREDELCLDGRCAQPPCRFDADCLDEQVCDASRGTCVTSDCVEDIYGGGVGTPPNHARQTAFPLQPGEYTNLALCPGRSDWFAIDLGSASVGRIELVGADAFADLDIRVVSATGEALAFNEEVGRISALKFVASEEMTAYIEVRATSFVTTSYALTIDTSERCVDDTFEENDSPDSATVLPTATIAPTELRLRACGFDEDWFVFRDLQAFRGISVTAVDAGPDLEVEVWTPDGARLDVPMGETYAVGRVGTAGDYFVRARAQLGQFGPYRLRFAAQPEVDCPDAGLHSDPTGALPLTAEQPLTTSLCPVDSAWELDWFSLDVPEPSWLDLTVSEGVTSPPLEIAVFDGSVDPPSLLRVGVRQPMSGSSSLRLHLDTSGTYFVRVSANQSVARFTTLPTYEVSAGLRP